MSENQLAVKMLAGVEFHYRPGTIDEMVIDEDYGTTRFLAPGYKPGLADTIVDAGAHIGAFTVRVAQLVPAGRVHAIEAARENIDVLDTNITANRLSNVAVHHVALSGRVSSPTTLLYHCTQSWGHSLGGGGSTPSGEVEEVPAQTLDAFLSLNRIQRVDYLKMNIEGAEYDLLLGARREALRRIQLMLVELHPAADALADELTTWLRSCGFVCAIEEIDHPDVKGYMTVRQT